MRFILNGETPIPPGALGRVNANAEGSANEVPGKWVCQGVCKELAPNLPQEAKRVPKGSFRGSQMSSFWYPLVAFWLTFSTSASLGTSRNCFRARWLDLEWFWVPFWCLLELAFCSACRPLSVRNHYSSMLLFPSRPLNIRNHCSNVL